MIRAKPELKKWRDELAKFSNEELCKLLSEGKKNHYDAPRISSILNGNLEPTKELMKRFCFLTGLPIGSIFEFDREAFLVKKANSKRMPD